MRLGRGAIVIVALAVAGCAGAGPQPAPQMTAPVTFADVAPIFYRSCAACHRSDGVAPFSLLAYADTKARAQDIVEAVTSRFMPPWLHGGPDV